MLFKTSYKTKVSNLFAVAKVIHLMKNLNVIFTHTSIGKQKSQKKVADELILVIEVRVTKIS
jgi:hypothetical protein